MIDSYEIVLYTFRAGISSTRDRAYKLKEIPEIGLKMLNDYEAEQGENVKLSVRDLIREQVIFTLDIADLKALKQSNDYIEAGRFIENEVKAYDLSTKENYQTARGTL